MILKSEIITSRNNPAVKWVCGLQLKKIRDKEKSFFVEGEKLSFEAIKLGLPLTRVYICRSKSDKIIPQIMGLDINGKYDNVQIFVLEDGVFEKISTENAPQGIISVFKYLDNFDNLDIIYKENLFLSACERSLILCSMQDPGNFGAVIRSAVAFGVQHIYVTADCADVYNAKTIRGAMGNLFRARITKVSDVKSLVSELKGIGRRVFAAELRDGAVSLGDICLSSNDVFIIGNEGHGVPEDVSSLCNGSVYIPISKDTESLNASVAASVIMWELSKI